MNVTRQPPTVVALIPARSGSKRIQGKNIRPLRGHPLIAYTIAAALASEMFADVIISTDSEAYAAIAKHYGASVPFLRPAEFAGDLSPDIEWVEHTLKQLRHRDKTFDCFSILRPTSPFRLPETILRAWGSFIRAEGVDSLRAVEKAKQHPGKMWVVRGERMTPLLPLTPPDQPWHSSQYQALPEVYVQNASLEIAWTRNVFEQRLIAGNVVMPFLTQGVEGVDVNQEQDWWYAEYILANGLGTLPLIKRPPYVDHDL